jgi:transposase-like protein
VSRTVLTIETKQEIIAKVQSGQKVSDIARQYGLNRSTVVTILAKKDIIKKLKKLKEERKSHLRRKEVPSIKKCKSYF